MPLALGLQRRRAIDMKSEPEPPENAFQMI